MRRLLKLLLPAAGLLGVLAPAASAQVPAGIFASDNIEWLGNRAIHTDTAGGTLHEGFFYITTERDLTIYDVKTAPENPTEVGRFLFPETGTPVFTEENPTTNGEILLVENGGVLMVIDVREKSTPKLLSTLDGVNEHTITCIADCTWAYGSEGAIVDLRTPEAPKAAGSWADVVNPSSSHDVTEVAPGYVLTSTEPPTLLDVRDPAKPIKLATGDSPGFVHANTWPHQMRDDWILVGGEGSGPDCTNNPESSFFTLDGRDWQKDKRFELVGEFKMNTGLFIDGASPESTFCVHWFDTHPSYVNGGLTAISWYEHGTRFLQVGTDGKIAEVGYYLPAGGQSSAIYWITDRIAYIADYTRGLDIVRFNGDIPQGRPHQTTPVSPGQPTANPGTGGPTTTPPKSTGVSFSNLVALPRRCGTARTFSVKTRKAKDPVVSLTAFVNGKRVGTFRGAKLKKALRVKKVPKRKAWSLQVQVKTKSGFSTAGQRKYRGCR